MTDKFDKMVGGFVDTVGNFLRNDEGDKRINDEKIFQEIKNGIFTNIVELETLPEEIAKILSEYDGDLWLFSLKSLQEPAAKHLSNHKGNIDLSGIPDVPDAVAKYLSKHVGDIELSDVVRAKVDKFRKNL